MIFQGFSCKAGACQAQCWLSKRGDCQEPGPEGRRTREGEVAMGELALQLKDYRLTTAEILYHLPDHPTLLQTYIWQSLDQAPRYPELHKFLAFWEKNLEGKL